MSYRAQLSTALYFLVAIGLIPRPQRVHDQALTNSERAACAVTIPNGSQPPVKNFGGKVTYSPGYNGPRDAPDEDSHGNGKLWTVLYPDGTVVFRRGGPGFILSDGSLSMKFPWWRGVRGKLTVEGRRLDSSAPPLRARIPEGYGDTGFQSTAIIFPTEGCWEVTGKVGQASLTFVTRVVRVKVSE
jgi:hypothetical protein